MTILDNIYFGTYFIEAFLLLRQSLLISVLLHDIEIVYNLSNNDIKRLESLDFQLVRRALACSSKVSKAIMMLELAICPLRFHIMKRRLMYCHFLLTTNDNNLAKLFLKQQIEDPAKGDIVSYIKSDLKSLNFEHLSFDDIARYSKSEFKRMITKQMNKAAFHYLLKEKETLKKSSFLMYNNFAIQNYLKTGANISKTNIQHIFCLQSESLDVAQNFSKKYQNNITCQHEACPGRDDQKHLYESCAFFTTKSDSFDKSIEYEEIFKNNVQNQLLISRKIFEAYNKREQYISFQQRGKNQRNPDFFQVDPGWQELIEDL